MWLIYSWNCSLAVFIQKSRWIYFPRKKQIYQFSKFAIVKPYYLFNGNVSHSCIINPYYPVNLFESIFQYSFSQEKIINWKTIDIITLMALKSCKLFSEFDVKLQGTLVSSAQASLEVINNLQLILVDDESLAIFILYSYIQFFDKSLML